jgi:hypothetical protein
MVHAQGEAAARNLLLLRARQRLAQHEKPDCAAGWLKQGLGAFRESA